MVLTSILFKFSHGLLFNCEFNNIGWVVVNSVYSCNEAKVTGSDTRLESVQGVHLYGKSFEDVKALSATRENVQEQFPKGIELFFPNLIVIRFSNGNLKSITAEDLRPFPLLKVLSLNANRILALDGDLFKYSHYLNWVTFEGNSISNVGRDILNDLSQLMHANFEKNICISASASSPEELANLKLRMSILCPLPETTTTQTSTTTPITSTTTTTPSTTTSTPSTTTSTSPTSTTTFKTSTEDFCSVRCTISQEFDKFFDEQSQINSLQNQTNQEQSLTNSQLLNLVENLLKVTMEQNEKLTNHTARISELEMQVIELGVRP